MEVPVEDLLNVVGFYFHIDNVDPSITATTHSLEALANLIKSKRHTE